MTDLHVTEWGDGDRVVLVHGSLAAGPETWDAQQPLADDRKLVLVDRRGFGDSPDGAADFDRDAVDVAELLEDRAHLVGNSYGGVVALIAAARRPEAVRSLAVIEPPALRLVRGDPVVDGFVERVETARREATDGAEYARRFVTAFGFPEPAPPEGRALRAATASWRERPAWEAEIPLDALERAALPTLVVRGAWDLVPTDARRVGHALFHRICDILVERLRARSVTIAGAAHSAHRGAGFNDELRSFWEEAL